MFLFKLHFTTKADVKKQLAYIGYFPICRTFVYASDWATHPFMDCHKSRYLNKNNQKIPVHFWHILETNVTDKDNLFRAISHRLFKTKVSKTDKLAWASMAILDPEVKTGTINQPYNHSKTPVKQTPKRRNSASSTKSVDSDSSTRCRGSKYKIDPKKNHGP